MRNNPYCYLPRCGCVRCETDVFEGTVRHNQGDGNDARISSGKGSRHRGSYDRPLVAVSELPLGAHVVAARPVYLHHGIYVGDGKIVHYPGLRYGLHGGPVEEVPFAHFSRGHPAWLRSEAPAKFDQWEVIRRARSRIGENRYRLLTNNCEHFCEWCLRGEQRSYQVEVWYTRVRRPLHGAARFCAQWHTRPGNDIESPHLAR
jgi:hypothetical protein